MDDAFAATLDPDAANNDDAVTVYDTTDNTVVTTITDTDFDNPEGIVPIDPAGTAGAGAVGAGVGRGPGRGCGNQGARHRRDGRPGRGRDGGPEGELRGRPPPPHVVLWCRRRTGSGPGRRPGGRD